MDLESRETLAHDLKLAAQIMAEAPIDGPRRWEILRACEAVRTALLGMGFDEGSSRKRVVSFLRSVALATGVIGKRTAHRLCHRTFEGDADAALKWLLEKGFLEDQGSEGFMLTDHGGDYLEVHKAEILPLSQETKLTLPSSDARARPAKSTKVPRERRDVVQTPIAEPGDLQENSLCAVDLTDMEKPSSEVSTT